MKQFVILFSFFLSFLLSLYGVILYTKDEVEFAFAFESTGSVAQGIQEQSFFTDSTYFLLRDRVPSLMLISEELTHFQDTQEIFMIFPHGVAYNSRGLPINYKGDRGHLREREEYLVLYENVLVEYENAQIYANQIDYNIKIDKIDAVGEVRSYRLSPETQDRIRIYAQELTSWPEKEESEYRIEVEGQIDRPRVYEESIFFSSDRLFLEFLKNKITLIDRVRVQKGELSARSLKGEIFLENYNKKLKYYVLYDDVKVEEKVVSRGDSFVRQAFGERLEGIVSEDLVILTGRPRVYQKTDVIKGNRITLRENNEVIEVDDAQTQFLVQ